MKQDSDPLRFFGLLFLLSAPFWVLGAVAGHDLLPGLPISAFMAICPALAAILMVWRTNGPGAIKSFLRMTGDGFQIRPWVWIVALATMPAVMVLSGTVLLFMGKDLPAPQISLFQALALFTLFFVAALAEEIGWTGYATRPLVKAHGLIAAGLTIGLVSAVWHVIPLLQVERSWDWIAWWALGSIARRMIIAWLYVVGGQSVFAASLFHTMSNVSWMLFPVLGSHYDPVSTALILVVLAAILIGPIGNSRELK